MEKKVTTKKKALKENLIQLIIFEILGAACLVLGFLIEGIMIFGLLFGVSFILIGIFLYFRGRKAIKYSYCPDCNTKYDYDDNINWEEVERIEKNDKVISKVEFKCVCPNCGKVQEFSQDFTVAHYDKQKGVWKENNLNSMVRKYFVK